MQETRTLFLSTSPASSQPEIKLRKSSSGELKILTQTQGVLNHKSVQASQWEEATKHNSDFCCRIIIECFVQLNQLPLLCYGDLGFTHKRQDFVPKQLLSVLFANTELACSDAGLVGSVWRTTHMPFLVPFFCWKKPTSDAHTFCKEHLHQGTVHFYTLRCSTAN